MACSKNLVIGGQKISPWLIMGPGGGPPRKGKPQDTPYSNNKSKATRPWTCCKNMVCPGVKDNKAWVWCDLPILQMECKYCPTQFEHIYLPFPGQKIFMGSLKKGPAPDQPMGTRKGGQTMTSPPNAHAGNMQSEQSSQEPAPRGTWRRGRRANQNEDTSEPQSGPTWAGVQNSDWPPLPTSLKGTKNAIKHVQGQLAYACLLYTSDAADE